MLDLPTPPAHLFGQLVRDPRNLECAEFLLALVVVVNLVLDAEAQLGEAGGEFTSIEAADSELLSINLSGFKRAKLPFRERDVVGDTVRVQVWIALALAAVKRLVVRPGREMGVA